MFFYSCADSDLQLWQGVFIAKPQFVSTCSSRYDGLKVVADVPLVMLLPIQIIGVDVAVADERKLLDVPDVGAAEPE